MGRGGGVAVGAGRVKVGGRVVTVGDGIGVPVGGRVGVTNWVGGGVGVALPAGWVGV